MQKIKVLVFDFDGVICALKEAHYLALNDALTTIDSKFVISEQEQISRFEGLSTRSKLVILVKEKNFPTENIEHVFQVKQKLTTKAIQNSIKFDPLLVSTFTKLKQEGFLLFVASNAIRETIELGLTKLGLIDLFDRIFANEDVKHTKPHPEIYLQAMIAAGTSPAETLIIEDSKNGRAAALSSGAHLCDVDSPADTTYDNIKSAIARAEAKNKPLPWSAKGTLTVLVPMAGQGSRLRAKYQAIKPLIDIHGKPMIQRVIESLNIDANYIFIAQKEHYDQYNLGVYLKLMVPGCTVITTDGLTDGACSTSLLAESLINNYKHLLIANSDQILDWNSSDFMYHMLSTNVDGGMLTFNRRNDPKWSYVKLDAQGYATELAEKKCISDLATIGIYYFNKGSEYVKAAKDMIAANDRVNNEFYIAPVFNYLIKDGKKINTFNIDYDKFHPTGTIEDLEKVLATMNFKD